MRIAILGGGPAGGALAWHLATLGLAPVVFEDRHPREKPCGGGVTGRAWRELPLLAELPLQPVEVATSWYIPPSRFPTKVAGHEPIRVYARRELDLAILETAARCGALWRQERARTLDRAGSSWLVNGEPFDLVCGADGASGLSRRTLGPPLAREDRLLCVGYFVPGHFAPEIRVEFFQGFRGYAWFFPRRDHASVGIGDGDSRETKDALYARLHGFLARRYPGIDLSGAVRYGGIAPCLKGPFARYPFVSPGLALLGDAAGFCDPLTGEGLYYAFASARLLAESIAAAGTPEEATALYRARAEEFLIPELEKGTKYLRYFFRRRYMETTMFFIRRSRTAHGLAADYVSGRQPLVGMRRRAMGLLPRVLGEVVTLRRGPR